MTRRTPGIGSSTVSGARFEILVEGNVVTHAVSPIEERTYH